MSIGVGLALLANSYMPDTEKRLREDQEVIETMFRKILREMALHLNNAQESEIWSCIVQI